MQPTPTMATAAASTAATAALTSRWDNTTSSPTVSEGARSGAAGRGGPGLRRPPPAVLTPAGPQAEPDPILNNYVLLVVVLSLFVGGTLVVLSGVLLLCRRCWEVHRRFNRCAAHPAVGPPWERQRGGGVERRGDARQRALALRASGGLCGAG